ncbi:MAG TPA: hypothetical protein VHQ20_02535, partial [Patescibacteria group bacterium]|nr:hypothetical protein [Patescibacteria group bacterium]
MFKIKRLLVVFAFSLLVINPGLVMAQGLSVSNTNSVGTSVTPTYSGVDQSVTSYLCTPSDPPDGHDLQKCVNKLYKVGVAFGAIAVVFFIVLAGYMYITGGESSKTKAKGLLRNSLVGIAILLGSYVVLSFVNPDIVIFKPIQAPIFLAADLPTCAEIGFGDDCAIASPGSDATIDLGQKITGGGKLVACGKQFTAADAGKDITSVSVKVWDNGS